MEIVGNEICEAENPKAIMEARHFSDVRFTFSRADLKSATKTFFLNGR